MSSVPSEPVVTFTSVVSIAKAGASGIKMAVIEAGIVAAICMSGPRTTSKVVADNFSSGIKSLNWNFHYIIAHLHVAQSML